MIEPTPCIRSAIINGLLVGGGMALHRLRRGSPTRIVVDVGYWTFVAVSTISFAVCTQYKARERELLLKGLEIQGVKKLPEDH